MDDTAETQCQCYVHSSVFKMKHLFHPFWQSELLHDLKLGGLEVYSIVPLYYYFHKLDVVQIFQAQEYTPLICQLHRARTEVLVYPERVR